MGNPKKERDALNGSNDRQDPACDAPGLPARAALQLPAQAAGTWDSVPVRNPLKTALRSPFCEKDRAEFDLLGEQSKGRGWTQATPVFRKGGGGFDLRRSQRNQALTLLQSQKVVGHH